MFPILQINAAPDSVETVGSKRKFWYTQDGQRYLFKAEERNTGEDWAEKVVCELAKALGIPCVHYDLASFPQGNLRGVVSANMAPPPAILVMGNQLLGIVDTDYPKEVRRKFGVRKYTVEAVATLMGGLLPPVTMPESTARGVFVAYLMLDALVANQDRHHQNWAAIFSDKKLCLAPTFDHGSSLARNLTDEDRGARLATNDARRTVGHFATRALSEFYPQEGDRTLPVIDAFRKFSTWAPEEADGWLKALSALSTEKMSQILSDVPAERMSEVTRAFTLELLTTNKERLLNNLP